MVNGFLLVKKFKEGKMIEELEKLINNYEKLKRDLTGHDLNSLELITELEGLFDNVVINREEWYLFHFPEHIHSKDYKNDRKVFD